MDSTTTETPLVSICCITYNHESFISETIEGFLMQEINFPIEILIHDDASTDSTRDVIDSYKEKYPHLIRTFYQKENQYSKGIRSISATFLFPHAKGKYIALCEGDDYWIDSKKLQKQVDFLEQNPDYSISSHSAVILGHNKKMIYEPHLEQTTFSTEEIIEKKWSIMTASLVFRKKFTDFPEWFTHVKSGDYAMQLLLSTKGKVNYMPEYMSVYRRHMGGLTIIQFKPYNTVDAMHFLLKNFDKETNGKYHTYIKEKMIRICHHYMRVAKDNGLRKQYAGLWVLYASSKLGVNLYPLISRTPYFHKLTQL